MSAVAWSKLGALRVWLLVLLGVACLVTAAYMWALIAGVAATGIALILLAYLLDDGGSGARR